MSDLVIRIERLGKQYRIGAPQPYRTLREALAKSLGAPFGRALRLLLGRQSSIGDGWEPLWALRDVSLEVARGEVVGIIGRNGAGKSTLLKILSRITRPTEGFADVQGRVGSLLEVGTGFHYELTGRENVFLNAAILGMKKAEVERRFDEIVAFAGVERFLDTPVKHYSSGMYLRLAFAVAAHLESEILLVDEVLAVGDLQFQRRCLRKMDEVARAGRTVLFVSHNLQAVKTLCTRAILLEEGGVQADGDVGSVTSSYLTRHNQVKGDGVIPSMTPRAVGTGEALLRQVTLRDADGSAVTQLFFGQSVRIGMVFEVKVPLRDVAVEVGISTVDGFRVATATSVDGGRPALRLDSGLWEVRVALDVVLQPGQYAIDVMLHHWETSKLTIEWMERALTFTALDVSAAGSDHYVCFASEYTLLHVRGFVRPDSTWDPPIPATETGTKPEDQ